MTKKDMLKKNEEAEKFLAELRDMRKCPDCGKEFKKDRDRFLIMFQEVFSQYRAFQEETKKRLNKLERGE